MAMAYAGTKDETEAAFEKVLYFGHNNLQFHKSYGEFALLLANKDRSDKETTFDMANTLWLDKDFSVLKEFSDTLLEGYNALPIELDFKNEAGPATDAINQAISKLTHGEIDKLLKSDLPSSTRLVLTNAIYFKSAWLEPFKPAATTDENFTGIDGTTTQVKMMKQENHMSYGENDNSQYLLMPYRDQEFATLFILPKAGKLVDVEQGLSEQSLLEMLKNLTTKKVSNWIPKFSQRATPNIKDTFVDMGLEVAFDSMKANFEGMAKSLERLYIENIVHEAVVKMYEEGTTAAAATAIVMVASAMPISEPEPVVDFHADRPFLYMIYHQPSGTILFMGKVLNPKSE